MRPASTSHSASTPPPCPPTAGIRTESTRSSVICRKGGIRSRRGQARDDGAAETREQPPPFRGILDDANLVERRAEHGGVRDLAADTAAHARVVHVSDGVVFQWVGALRQCQ